ncbi:2-succinyl-6-hydroxy-2,4-cyclohexadiene-1-carboxylate synthase [Halobacillus salinarum]|uniref:Putative 2-succinyl-6-hydroxy-2,4-cyclohexadiene-1-carboxylate synthase n=1 Tax=Halobacillus salinarum TaxID=2932257 RepID=A0ABY4ENW0_9BACI|nr:2-succinyl-6-hydroxy-2,4-cyclohexadiene-1-carboxylate synthase [Halobacillus salinarum]UOQ46080.1 2-succinyl-6-hydroxy-2,4-cyclohexadiene-1-carboxylate synthase [Halobacillus salinarum]
MYVSVQQRKYWLEDKGEGGPILLCLHGFTGSLNTFDELVNQLSSRFRILSIDMPGHARTGVLGQLNMEQFCSDLNELLNQLSIPSVQLLGYSMGGRAALSFALLYPEKVNKLILESASPGLEKPEEQKERKARDAALARRIEDKGIESFIDYWENIPLFDSQQELPIEQKVKIKEERLHHHPVGLIQSLLGMGTGSQPSWWRSLSVLSTPLLLITGMKDEKFKIINRRMDSLALESQLTIVEGAGHAVHLENPKLFTEIVEAFVIQ